MRKLIFIVAMVCATCSQVISSMVANPIISRGKPVFTSSGSAAYLVDNAFNTSKWTVTNGSWIAIHVSAGPSKVFVNWNSPAYAWSKEMAPAKCPQTDLHPNDYNLLISSNSTNGSDGQWTTAASITGNIVTSRGHLIDFTGASWVKMQIVSGGGQLDEIEVFDASNGTDDVWFFAGTSITANTFKATPPAQNFADLITTSHPGFNPAIMRGGIGCITSTDMVSNLSNYLKMASAAHFWAIEMGTNDAWGGTNGNVPTFKKNLQTIIDSCTKAGIQPMIARTIATDPSLAGWQVHADYLTAIDDLTTQNNLMAGPDLYTYFLAHPEELANSAKDGIHPNATGAASIQRLWAQKMLSIYGTTEVRTSNADSENIRIFPNPTGEGKFQIVVNNFTTVLPVTIYDIQGKLAYRSVLYSKETELNTGLNRGVYIIKITTSLSLLNQKLVIN